jgi:hypothetical protein
LRSPPQLVRASKRINPSEAGRVTIIISDHYRWIQRLKIEDENGVFVESRWRFLYQGLTFCSVLFADLYKGNAG